ncbi:GGDEF domain-containing protein [Carboxydothermus pertinax]|nr:GGDEF domain-containing protein [Carboxydothermus pertinax]
MNKKIMMLILIFLLFLLNDYKSLLVTPFAVTLGILFTGYGLTLKKPLNRYTVILTIYIFSSFYFIFNWRNSLSYPLVLLLSVYFYVEDIKNSYFPLFFLAIPIGMLLSTIFYHTPFDLTSIFKPFLTIALSEIFLKLAFYKTLLPLKFSEHLESAEVKNVKELLMLSYTDSLTGLYNRRLLEEEAKMLDWQASQSSLEYALLLADIDFFKQYNDTLGHLAGDEALKQIATSIKSSVRTQDKVFRFGGEEFLIILPQTSPEKARQIAERIRHAVARNQKIPLTLSIGIGHYPQNAKSFWDVVKIADEALYKAKNKGRNTVYLLNS